MGTACAGTLYNGESGTETQDTALIQKIRPGQVVIVSEQHGLGPHHQNQRDILAKISNLNIPINVGMEFFEYPDQPQVDNYLAGKIDESEFLKQVKWGKISYDNYRVQVNYPVTHNGTTLALNLPRAISGKVKSFGLESLSEEEYQMLPPHFEIGRDSYYERFHEVMKEHATEEQMRRYFIAQSLWDETMAWKAADFIRHHPDQLLVIIVGDFHVAYQDGLIARLRARGAENILSVSQVDTRDLSEEERIETIRPSARYGVRADFIYDVR